ncbi:TVP38/TMEM64 family protein [Sneathiella sp.]|uniref:TVP38/TMEM64 family protein n=1 Tax=Sneathiella sp. TaxID=1964365 RepID=UPI002FDF30EA
MAGSDSKKRVPKKRGKAQQTRAPRAGGAARPRLTVTRLLPLALVALAIAAFFAFGLDNYLTFRALSENRDRLLDFVASHYVAAAMLYMSIYIAVVALSLPGGLLMTVTGGFLFGWVAAGVMTVIAATLGATLIFLIAATSLGTPLRARAGPWLKKLEAGFAENAMSYLLFLRLVPLFPFWLVNVAPAFLGVRTGTYILGTLIGIIPGTFAFAYLGGGLDSIIRQQQATYSACMEAGRANCALDFQISSLLTGEMLVAFAALGVLALVPVIVKKLRGRGQ